MTAEEIKEAERRGREDGANAEWRKTTEKRVSRLEAGFLAILVAAAFFYLQSKGIIP